MLMSRMSRMAVGGGKEQFVELVSRRLLRVKGSHSPDLKVISLGMKETGATNVERLHTDRTCYNTI